MGMHGPRRMMGEKQKKSRPNRVLLGRMISYLGKFKRIVAIGAALSLVATIVSIFNPIILSIGINSVLARVPVIETIITLTLLYFILKVTSWLMYSANVWILSGAQAGFIQNIQEDIYSKLLRADLSYHKGQQSGNVTSRVTSDTVELGTGVQVLIDFSSQVLMLVSSFVLLFIISPYIALT